MNRYQCLRRGLLTSRQGCISRCMSEDDAHVFASRKDSGGEGGSQKYEMIGKAEHFIQVRDSSEA